MQYDMEELLEQANEVQESLARSYAVPDEIDEADLEAGESFSFLFFESIRLNSRSNTELDALGMEDEEEEGSSYLADLNKAPDFIDEAPLEVAEVRMRRLLPTAFILTLRTFYSKIRQPQRLSRLRTSSTVYAAMTCIYIKFSYRSNEQCIRRCTCTTLDRIHDYMLIYHSLTIS
jgi:hypothetical protein